MFTLVPFALLDKKRGVTMKGLLRNWGLVFVGNFAGAMTVALFNTEQGFYAIGDVCPHLGGPLSDGEVARTTVACPLHLRKIELTTGEILNDELPRVATFPVKVEGEYVLLDTAALSSRMAGRKRAADKRREEVA